MKKLPIVVVESKFSKNSMKLPKKTINQRLEEVMRLGTGQ
jgi:hypothetical protein